MKYAAAVAAFAMVAAQVGAQSARTPNWAQFEQEALTHFQALVRIDTSDPPGNEKPVADYLVQALQREGIAVQVFAKQANRPNIVARLKGNGSKRPLLIMGHTDVVNVDPAKWIAHGPFSADRDGGYIYGRGSLDNKPSVLAGLMILLELKRLGVPLNRDVIFLAEAGEEGSTQMGIEFMANEHFADIDAEYCLAEGGGVRREGGKATFARVQTTEKIPRAIEVVSKGISGHASRPQQSNAIAHLGLAVSKLADLEAPIQLNETTASYFRRLAQISSGATAERYRDVLDPQKARAVDRYFRSNDIEHAAMLHTTLSPTIIDAGYRVNVIPSEAKATIDVRLLPDDDPQAMLELFKKTVNDPGVTIQYTPRSRPGGSSRLDTEAFRAIESAIMRTYAIPTVPAMSTGATDMSYLRAKGVQCYGMGAAVDAEDLPLGYGAHSDQERILEAELQRYLRWHWDVVTSLAASR
jgi:acetylornithine deacetylase/succinyl-diaminopimelate desuccinylase-like protein